MKLNGKKIKVDPYLYFKDNIICDVYVDGTIYWPPNNSKIDETISELKRLFL